MKKRVSSYISDILEEFGMVMCDFVCFSLGLVLLIMPWRLISDFKAIQEAEGTTRIAQMFTILAETTLDLLYFLPFSLVLVSIYRIPRLFSRLYAEKCTQ